jgi:hypothetical protein
LYPAFLAREAFEDAPLRVTEFSAFVWLRTGNQIKNAWLSVISGTPFNTGHPPQNYFALHNA